MFEVERVFGHGKTCTTITPRENQTPKQSQTPQHNNPLSLSLSLSLTHIPQSANKIEKTINVHKNLWTLTYQKQKERVGEMRE
jgi:hypothetical protein